MVDTRTLRQPLDDTTMSSSFTPSWPLVRPQLVGESGSVKWLLWLARATVAGDGGACARPGFLGGMGGGLPRSALGMTGERMPGDSAPLGVPREEAEREGELGAMLR